MIPPLHLQAIAEMSAAGILLCIVGGVPIALFAWILLRAFSRQNSGTRFMFWFSTLLSIALLPLVGVVRTVVGGSRTNAVAASSGSPHSLVTIPGSWATIIFALWGLFATVALGRVAVGFVKLRRLRRSCRAIDVASLDPILRETLREFTSPRAVRILVSDKLRVPTAIGFVRPLVVLPAWALDELSASELKSVLLHELAHLKRWDDWTNLVQKLIQAVLFFHPAVWWIENRLSLEREMACDDVVLAHTESPRAYAQCLLSVAEKSWTHRGLSLAQAAVTRMRQTSVRIARILGARRPSPFQVWIPASVLLAAFSLLALAAVPQMPRLVAFQESQMVAPPAAVTREMASTPHAKLIQAPVMRIETPRSAVSTAAIEAKPAGSLAQNNSRRVRNGIIEAKFSGDSGGAPRVQRRSVSPYGGASFTETVFVITRSQQDEVSTELWTVDVWQLTVFKPNTTPVRNLSAKKV